MKKILALMLALVLALSLAGCGNKENNAANPDGNGKETPEEVSIIGNTYTISTPDGIGISCRNEGEEVGAYDGRAPHAFIIEADTESGYVCFHLDGTDYYLGVSGGADAAGTNIIIWSKTGSDSQRFTLEAVDAAAGQYRIATKGGNYFALSGSFLSLVSDSADAVVWTFSAK